MGLYLNSNQLLNLYLSETKRPYFVDKSLLLEELFPLVYAGNSHVCITRPRRFGKSVMAAMVGAFFSKGVDSSFIFDKLKISHHPEYKEYLNQYNVIFINFASIANLCDNYNDFINVIERDLLTDLMESFPSVELEIDDVEYALWAVSSQLEEKFIFIFDEWDCILHKDYMTDEDREAFIGYLTYLTKDTDFISLSYMTGITPIVKYSSGSSLNNFMEYTITTDNKYSNYFGFTSDEVDDLYKRYLRNTKQPIITRDDLKYWYEGYSIGENEKIYNPWSIVLALSDNQITRYWISICGYSEVDNYIVKKLDDMKDCILRMINEEEVEADINEYVINAYISASAVLPTRNEILSMLVVQGFLTYKDGYVRIPNKEILDEFKRAVQRLDLDIIDN